jgi:hypothetical protein
MLRRRRQIAQTIHHHDPSPSYASSSDNEDEQEEILLRHHEQDDADDDDEEEEAEQERLLSEQHGEANESPTSSSLKRRQTDADIAKALNDQTLLEDPKKKKQRLTLTTSKLVSPEGLIRVRHEFGKIHYRPPPKRESSNKEKRLSQEVQASAVYLKRLIQSYEDFAMDLAPNMHYSDTFRKIQDLGGKKEVRDYLNTMRQEICREHLHKVYGTERAEKFINELEYGRQSFDDGAVRGGDKDEEEEEEGKDNEAVGNVVSRQGSVAKEQDKNVPSKKVNKERKSNDDDSDDDYEASFDDVQPSIQTNKESPRTEDGVDSNSYTAHPDDDDLNDHHHDTNHDDNEEEHSPDLQEPTADIQEPFETNNNTQQQDETPFVSNNDEHSHHHQEDNHDITMTSTEINDPSNISSSNQVMEHFHTQDSTHIMFQSQENNMVNMTQDTVGMLFGTGTSSLGQTQGLSQETLVFNASLSLTQTQPDYEATQDTLIVDASQEMGNTQNTCNDTGSSSYNGGSQDY